MNKTTLLHGIKKYFTPAYIVVVVVFLCWFFYKFRHSLYTYLNSFTPGWLVLSAFLLIFFYVFQCRAFMSIQSNNAEINSKDIAAVNWFYAYIYGLMGHYIPGKISVVLGRIMALGHFEIKKQAAVLSVFYETLLFTAVAFALGLPLLLQGDMGYMNHNAKNIGAILIFVLIIIFIFTPLFKKCTFWILRLFHVALPSTGTFLTRKTLLQAIIANFLSCVFMGLSFFCFCLSVVHLPFAFTAVYVSGIGLVFSAAIGILALFAPSGLGVREAGVVYFISVASNLVPADAALLIAVCYRILTAIIEIVLFISITCLFKRRQALSNRSY